MRLRAAVIGNLEKELEKETRAGRRAVTRAVRDVGKDTQAKLRRQVTSAGLGRRVEKTWRVANFPRGGDSLGAASLVFSKAPDIVDAFTRGATIRAKNRRFLAYPLAGAPKRGIGGKRLTPANFPENRLGELRFVPLDGGGGLLVVDNLRGSFSRKTGDLRGFRRASQRALKTGRGLASVAMFRLVPSVKLPKKLDVARVAAAADRRLAREILRNWESEGSQAR